VTDSNQATTATGLDDAACLRQLRADFPAFRIWREMTGERTAYIARRRQPGTRPHTLVTSDPHELHAALASNSAGAQLAPEPPRPNGSQ
jgi:hypothetical protein